VKHRIGAIDPMVARAIRSSVAREERRRGEDGASQ
jgi:hypothetical protein